MSQDQAQVLWNEFHDLCEAVYKRREQASKLYFAGLEAAKEQAIALCEQVEQAVSPSAAERMGANAKVREWHAAFDALEEMPRADARALRDRFERAISRYETSLADQDLRDAEAAESNLFEAARQIESYERAVMQGAPPADCETRRNAAEGFIAGVQRWPKGGLQALQQALARADSASGSDDVAREKALRMLCIRAEILSSTPTPADDEELRRDYQMRLLMEGLGQASRADDRDWDAMLLEWIGVGAIMTPAAQEDLQRRFLGCLAKRPARSSQRFPIYEHDVGNAGTERRPSERPPRRDGRGRSDTHPRR